MFLKCLPLYKKENLGSPLQADLTSITLKRKISAWEWVVRGGEEWEAKKIQCLVTRKKSTEHWSFSK